MRVFDRNDAVHHAQFGRGVVMADEGATVVVRFDSGIYECRKGDLRLVESSSSDPASVDPPIEVMARALALAIESVNDSWGVFSRSRIDLLPHQLWVCHLALRSWPMRWLIADDVGLGKTIEAGLILWPLLAKNRVRRLLILAPASLVEQWQYRLRTMFDIRVATYVPELDTERSDFWNSASLIAASVHTLRADRNGRHDRLLAAEPWDLVIVDEAHHLNHEEQTGPTLAYELVERLQERDKVRSLMFFTGTPHKGKDFNFMALLKLLRPDEIQDPHEPLSDHLHLLPNTVIRNNKYTVTDLEGTRLFEPPTVTTETYRYSEAEEHFYDAMTDFVASGKAYASTLGTTDARTAQLVLITLQKLASSSIAAVRRALQRRLERLNARAQENLDAAERALGEPPAWATEDDVARHEERLAELTSWLTVVKDEPKWLQRLLDQADLVTEETKIEAILQTVRERFSGRSVLFFTEYKATQSLLLSRLTTEYGSDQVGFINGDGRADNVLGATLVADRVTTAERYNGGELRFLVSTEAAGEGIDLQGACHTLIHVDLPWNPMRLHQRVGRVNRFGQKHHVDVVAFRNPDTVESRIWEKLNEKIVRIQQALAGSMDEPEDLFQLVLGMTSPEMFTSLFADANSVPKESLGDWFDERTARFGGDDVLSVVNALVGNAAKFDFKTVAPQIPRLDLPDLEPFFRTALGLNRRKVTATERGLSFISPDAWRDSVAVKERYVDVAFDRHARDRKGDRVIGVGHPAFDRALQQCVDLDARHAVVPSSTLGYPVLLFKARNRVTTDQAAVSTVLRGVAMKPDGLEPLCDAEVFNLVRNLLSSAARLQPDAKLDSDVRSVVRSAEQWLAANLDQLELPFDLPAFSLEAALWPRTGATEPVA
jgi:ERCC4-related helicase